MKLVSIIGIAVFIFFSVMISYGQGDQIKKSYLKIGANYLSNAVYSGRKDSATVSYFRPSIGYYSKSGLFVSSEISLLSNYPGAGRIDELAIETGYNFEVNKLDGGLYASKYFYSIGSYAVASELIGEFGGYVTYDPGFLKLGTGTDVLFSTGTDITVNANISHPFEMSEWKGSLSVAPTLQAIAGTQTFYRDYYKNRKFSFTSGNGKSKGHHINNLTNGSQVISFSSKNQFEILDYEMSLPIQFETQRLRIYATPQLALPVNPSNYMVDEAIQTETLSASLYTEIGIYFKF
jgi:hypothetical protein